MATRGTGVGEGLRREMPLDRNDQRLIPAWKLEQCKDVLKRCLEERAVLQEHIDVLRAEVERLERHNKELIRVNKRK